MFRHTTYALLATLLLTAGLHAQEPVFGLDAQDTALLPGEDPSQALMPSYDANFASMSGGGITHGGYVDNQYYGDTSYGGCSSCGDYCGGCDCYCGCPPTMWRVRSSTVYMSRESSDDSMMVLERTFTNQVSTLLNAADFSFEWETGFDISLMQGDGYGGEVELRALYLNDMDDRLTATGNGNVELFTGDLSAANSFSMISPRTAPVDVTADYHSEFRTLELNYREAFTPWWTVMVGFRYGNLDDELDIRTRDAGALTSRHSFYVDNDMYGFQAGTEYIVASNPSGWDVITSLKGGVYYNRVDLRVRSTGNGFPTGDLSFVTGETAWLGEANLQVRRHFSCNGTFTLGYSVLSIDGVSAAPEQISTVNGLLEGNSIIAGTGLRGSSNRSTLFYHDVNAGIEIRW